ncbi:hypothetical protein BDW72DRAFT_84938 [Aspergillus terricola var. indicus]
MRYLARKRSSHVLKQHHAFHLAVVKPRSPPTEVDPNLHKSYSTHITDVDVSRAHLSGLLCVPILLSINVRCIANSWSARLRAHSIEKSSRTNRKNFGPELRAGMISGFIWSLIFSITARVRLDAASCRPMPRSTAKR